MHNKSFSRVFIIFLIIIAGSLVISTGYSVWTIMISPESINGNFNAYSVNNLDMVKVENISIFEISEVSFINYNNIDIVNQNIELDSRYGVLQYELEFSGNINNLPIIRGDLKIKNKSITYLPSYLQAYTNITVLNNHANDNYISFEVDTSQIANNKLVIEFIFKNSIIAHDSFAGLENNDVFIFSIYNASSGSGGE